jgi:aminoglycoside phosphotransferase (APT) family kinase protein
MYRPGFARGAWPHNPRAAAWRRPSLVVCGCKLPALGDFIQPVRQAPTSGELAQALAAALEQELPAPVEVVELERLTGGASRETWSFDAVDAMGERHGLILRRDFPERAEATGEVAVAELGRSVELVLQRALHAAGALVPRPLGAPPQELGLRDCYLMERIDGESRPRAIARKPELAGVRARLAEDTGHALARIHSVDVTSIPGLPQSGVEQQLALVRKFLDDGPAPRPALELGLRWSREHRPRSSSEPRLVHGDFRNGNLIVGEDGLLAVVDWEYAHLGEPLEDLGFLCMRPWRFGNDDAEVGGFGSRDQLYRAYEEAGGGPVDPELVRFWEVVGNLKWGALCVLRGMEHASGKKRSVELAAIGRRVAETEYDLLELLS